MSEKIIGYKVMKFDNDKIISGADNRQAFNLEVGSTIEMTGNGIYLGVNKEYVHSYYAGLADIEVMLTLEFNKSDIITGQLTDKEPELSVRKAKILNTELIVDGEYVKKPTVKDEKSNKKNLTI
jgi:hypothetical protein